MIRIIRLNWLLVRIAVFSTALLCANRSIAQIKSDATLPNNSNVILQNSTSVISGGTTVGANLSHSFSEFSVPKDLEGRFDNASNIQNILTRVTGSSESKIDGSLRTLGTANLFLMNPNGITFGKNARLNIGGSFVATTANAIGFGDGKFFSASNPQAPSSLLTINPSAFLFNQIAAPIQNESISKTGTDLAGFQALGLRVPNGKSLSLLGGNINISGGQLNAYSGRVELGGLASQGNVGLEVNGDNLSLNFPKNTARARVSLSNKAKVHVEGNGGGTIAVNAQNIDISGNSSLSAGVGQGLGNPETVAGNILLNATGEIKILDSNVLNRVRTQALGNGGNLTINTGLLRIQDGAFISTSTFGAGKGGNLDITAKSIEVIGRSSSSGNFSFLSAQASSSSTGDAGNLKINTDSLLIRDGAFVSNGTFGAGNGGNLDVSAKSIEVVGSTSSLSSQANREVTGNAGNLTIKTGSLLVQDGAFVSTNTLGIGKGGNLTISADSLSTRNGGRIATRTFGKGKGGNLNVTAQTIELIGRSNEGNSSSGLFTSTNKGATGDAGNLIINTASLSIRDGAQILARNDGGQGNAGSVTINASETVHIGAFEGNGRATIGTDVTDGGIGNGNDINIKARSIVVDNDAVIAASILDGKGEDGKLAQAGNVNITADNQVYLNDGGRIYSEIGATSVRNGGTINITAPRVSLDNGDLITRIQKGGTGRAGNINITVGTLDAKNKTQVLSSTSGYGNAGNVKISASDSIVFTDSYILARVEADAIGKGGDINITTELLEILNGAELSATTVASDNASGNIDVAANSIRLDQGTISADTTAGQGNINLRSRDLILLRRSNITTNATGSNIIGGNINIDTDVLALLESSIIAADSANSRGGNVNIKTQGLFRSPDSTITASGATSALSGNVNITTLADPSKDLVPLTVDVVDVARLVDDNICARTAKSSFTFIGRGGIPDSPDTPAVSNFSWEDWRLLQVSKQQSMSVTAKDTPISSTTSPEENQIVEAQAWMIDSDGTTILTAAAPVSLPESLSQCQ